tara:strand:+ start:1584 stop:1943 length:360 start_codon:yes stop_codon:yes gene_type:complete
MGIRSDVAFAAKPDVVSNLTPESRETILRYFGEPVETTDEGMLWFVEGTKWYSTLYPELVALYKDLGQNPAFEEADYLLIEGCYDYPEHGSEGDIGEWYDNPWGVHRNISISLDFELTA